MSIFGEINCYGQCLRSWAPIVAFIVIISITSIAASLMLNNPKKRLQTFIFAQFTGLIGVALTFYLMNCSEMLSMYLYFAYVAISTILIFGTLYYYDRLMIKRLEAKPAGSILKWTQEYVDKLTSARVYYFDSAVPKAFAAGRSIFISIGLLEILDDNELKSVLAHEAWHIRHNSGMPFISRLAMMAFSSTTEPLLEEQADRFAAEIAGRKALFSARNKVDKVFI